MKEDNHHHHHHQQSSNLPHRRSSSYTWHQNSSNQKILSFGILLLLTYTLGYFTASFIQQPPTVISPTVVRTATKPTELTAVNNCPSATSSRVIMTDKSSNDHNKFGSSCKNPVGHEFIRSLIIDRVFDGTSPYLNFPPAHVAHLLKPKKIKGWGSYGAVFEKLIKKVRPRTIIEVGTFLGASATHMAELTRRLGLETQILCVDDFRGWPGFRKLRNKVNYVPVINGDVLLYQQFIQNVISLNSSESIIPVPFSTGSALVKLCEWGVSAELIEVDAGHDFHSAWSDINLAYKLLKPGGVMFGHDYFTAYDNRGVRRAIDLFARVHGFKVKTDGQHWVLDDQ